VPEKHARERHHERELPLTRRALLLDVGVLRTWLAGDEPLDDEASGARSHVQHRAVATNWLAVQGVQALGEQQRVQLSVLLGPVGDLVRSSRLQGGSSGLRLLPLLATDLLIGARSPWNPRCRSPSGHGRSAQVGVVTVLFQPMMTI